jgi:Tfp pilus assembly protein PilV
MKRACVQRKRRDGITLLEVILAIAILGSSMAMISELVRVGSVSAARARDYTNAQLICESKLNELIAGAIPIAAATQQQVADMGLVDLWYFSVVVNPLDTEGLVAVQVLVEKGVEQGQRPMTFSLMRWMVDPALEQEAVEQQLEAEALEAQNAADAGT